MRVYAKAYLCGSQSNPDETKRRLASSNPGALVQATRAGSVRNEFFVEMLAAQTFHAESSGSLLAKKREIDFLLRLAGTTQISRAIKAQGAKAGERFLVVTAHRRELKVQAELSELELPRRPLTRTELARIERAALLNAQKS
jgi:tRNA threonylcarbamoyladenosine modification (KEOPS) complex Cgi121 subunit